MNLRDTIARLREAHSIEGERVFTPPLRHDMMSTINALVERLGVARKGLKMVTGVCQSDLETHFGKKIANQIQAGVAACDLEKEGVCENT